MKLGETGSNIAKVIVGGTLSEITGGKFSNGAAYAAFTVAAQSLGRDELPVGGGPDGGNNQDENDESKSEFDEFMDFIRENGVERGVDEPFIHEKVAGEWGDPPQSVRAFEGNSIWGSIIDDIGNHVQNQRLPGGYHLTVDEGISGVRVHYDVHDPLDGISATIRHGRTEVQNVTEHILRDDYIDWGAQIR